MSKVLEARVLQLEDRLEEIGDAMEQLYELDETESYHGYPSVPARQFKIDRLVDEQHQLFAELNTLDPDNDWLPQNEQVLPDCEHDREECQECGDCIPHDKYWE